MLTDRQDKIIYRPIDRQFVSFFSEMSSEAFSSETATASVDEETPVPARERTESEIEIERQVSSLFDQIKGETSWQYHLTSPELDEQPDSPIFGEHRNGHLNGEIDIELDKRKNLEVNGDVNANEADDVITEQDDDLKMKMKGEENILSTLKKLLIDAPSYSPQLIR